MSPRQRVRAPSRSKTAVEPSPPGPVVAPPIVNHALQSTGRGLDSETRRPMEAFFGRDLSQVRVHTDEEAEASARAVGAMAYTVGPHVVFAAGQYQPRKVEGRGLIAHELAHVDQQGGVGVAGATDLPIVVAPANDGSEADALAAGRGITSAERGSPTRRPASWHGASARPLLQRYGT
ncbi:MAG TPA: DUF4157 domain-containing protein, partial [Candidatus Eisenbacteria bacterium]|nr:DUF4157 domain-containing protein [Candidatus Eisenbacteria bacterium]